MSEQTIPPADGPAETTPLDLIRSIVLDEELLTEDIMDRLRAALDD